MVPYYLWSMVGQQQAARPTVTEVGFTSRKTTAYALSYTATMNSVTATRIRTAGIYIPLVTRTLSVLGSGSILYSIWARRTTKLTDPQHRILGMMSIFDVFIRLIKR